MSEATKRLDRTEERMIERTRAAVRLVNASNNPGLRIEAFMGLFHPEKQADRAYMAELKRGLREGNQP